MKQFKYILILSLALGIKHNLFAIVAKHGVAIEKYAKLAENINNVGRLMSKGSVVKGEIKTSSCSSTFIGKQGNIGIILTAGHCAELTSEETVKKCRHQTISFAPNKTDSDPQQLTVIGRFALGKYIESSTDLAYDLGIVFVHLEDATKSPTPQRIQLEAANVLPKSLVQVVGYGRTSEKEEEKTTPPQRRIMSTQAFRTKEQSRDVLLLDESGIENQPLTIPVGDHPAEGDSGGPIIDAATGAVIGVVSHRSSTNEFYSEPLYPHAKWIITQMNNAARYLVFKPKKSGSASDRTTWSEGRRPIQFKNNYGEINPIIEIDEKRTISFNDGLSIYAINMVGQGGTLNIQEDQSAEVLRVNAPTVIESPKSKTLTVDDVSINTSDISLQTQLRVLHAFNIQQGIEMNVQKDNPTRGLTLVESGTVNVEGTLKTHHVKFATLSTPSSTSSGTLRIAGTLESATLIDHSDHTILGVCSKPGQIIGDYSLSQQGVLAFNIDTAASSSTPILTIDGFAKFMEGKVSLSHPKDLPIGFKQTLIQARELKVEPTWQGMYHTPLDDPNAGIEFIRTPTKLTMKVVSVTGKSSDHSATDDLLK